ncbi:Serine/threonine-protein kinase [Blastocystis sp. ATCC 50177/Nand II]|uniref:non-specific serine/threonine protein kinase n=1 Tax=Blastocystis sp. subtype 1 (strain ATCC 50177 / NandII) TaxID=478820 RepID=A0A196SJK7_BLAHN|nr:Serine/threonine-protein kinase [Blastocystis sp. ATCC 50177/Nand II]
MNSAFAGNYEFIRKLGKGSFGEVWVAKEKHSCMLVAIKKVKEKGNVKAIQKEANSLRNSISSFIVRYHDVLKKGNEVWIVMEYCRCGSVANYMRRGNRLTEEQIREIASCCVLGLSYLHSMRIVHRDIKPDNLLLSENGVAKVCDFGLAAQLDPNRKGKDVICGTPLYMAPEVFRGKEDLKSDVWSLGISLVEMAEGTNPFAGCSSEVLRNRVLNVKSPALSSSKWSSEFVDFVGKCLEKDVKKRWSVSELMEHAFVKDSVRGLTEKGNSVLLLELAKKVGNMPGMIDGVTKSVAQSHVNMVEMTVLGGQNGLTNMDAIEEEPTNENVFVMEETGDFFLTYETSEGIVVKDGVGNDEVVASWDMGLYKSLRELIIGDGCFAYMAGLKLEGMDTLEKVEIGGECFSLGEGKLEVVNCVKMKCLKIGSDSCVGWSEFVLRDCAVEEVEIGDGCFVNCEKIVLEELKELNSLIIDWNTFLNVKEATFVNVPNLSQLNLGNAFSAVETVTMSNASLIEQESRNEVIVHDRKEL